jgi:tetratricopeptide (TPR) repeat protein/TolB-like protein
MNGFLPKIGAFCGFLLLLFLSSPTPAATSSNRLSVAVLGFENKTGESQSAHWGDTLQRLLSSQLTEVKSLSLVPTESHDYGYRQLKLKPSDPVDSEKARRIGEFIEARRVVRGGFQRQEGKWQATAEVVNVASGKSSPPLTAASTNWFDLSDRLVEQILKELGVTPSAEERVRMAERSTSSSVSLEWYSKARALHAENKPAPEVEECARKAVAADPQNSAAYVALAVSCGTQGKLDQAEEAIRQALKLKPDSATAHQVLGTLFLFQVSYGDALKEFEQALILDPDDPEVLSRIGQMYAKQENWARAIFYFNEAKKIYPTSAAIHAALARIYAEQANRTKSVEELQEAERLGSGEDVIPEQAMAEAYDTLHETSLALAHYERFVTLARKLGLNPKGVNQYEEREQELKATLTPVYLTVTEPKAYDEKSLEDALRARLTKEELALVANPLASNAEMQKWARQLTEGATDDLQKGRRLFEGLASRLDPGPGGSRTAREVFADWQKPDQSFRCQEYARLYVALARAVGLKAYFVLVGKDANGKQVLHACSAFFLGSKLLLVDPSYRWFGAPHKTFDLLDDFQGIVHHLNQLDKDLPRLRLAAKLDPNSGISLYKLAFGLLDNERLEEGRSVLNKALSLDPNGWMAGWAQGLVAYHDLEYTQAASFFRKSIEINPDRGETHAWLGKVLFETGRHREARAELRAGLRCGLERDSSDHAIRLIAEINEQIGPD